MNDFLSNLPDSQAEVDPPQLAGRDQPPVSLNVAYFLLV